MSENPILEANPASLDDLFSNLNIEDDKALERIILEFRRARVAWESGQPIRKAKEPKKKLTLADLGLDKPLDELGLE